MTVVATESALRTAIQRLLHDLAKTGRFFRVYYDADGKAVAIDPNESEQIAPVSLEVNEVSADFIPDELFGRDINQRRSSWNFELHLGFDQEVTVAFFEQDVLAPVPRVKQTENHTYAWLRLNNVSYDHPARGGSAGGTSVVMTFEATIGR